MCARRTHAQSHETGETSSFALAHADKHSHTRTHTHGGLGWPVTRRIIIMRGPHAVWAPLTWKSHSLCLVWGCPLRGIVRNVTSIAVATPVTRAICSCAYCTNTISEGCVHPMWLVAVCRDARHWNTCAPHPLYIFVCTQTGNNAAADRAGETAVDWLGWVVAVAVVVVLRCFLSRRQCRARAHTSRTQKVPHYSAVF